MWQWFIEMRTFVSACAYFTQQQNKSYQTPVMYMGKKSVISKMKHARLCNNNSNQ